MNLNLWKGFDNVVLWGVEHALAYNVLTSLQQQNIYALVTDNDQKQALIEKLKEQDFDAKLSIEQAYLNDKEGKETLREFSLPQFNSLKTATGVFDIYPGLKQVQMQSVHCLSPESLLQRYELSNQAKNVLWLEVNGQITVTIKNLLANQNIFLFTKIVVFLPGQAWYESETDANELIDELKQAGFDVSNKDIELDTDQTLYEFTRHSLVLKNNVLEKALREFEITAQTQNEKVNQLTKNLEGSITQEQQCQVKVAELTQRENQAKQEKEGIKTELVNLRQKLDATTKESEDLKQHNVEKYEQLQELREALATEQQQVKKLNEQLLVKTKANEDITQQKQLKENELNGALKKVQHTEGECKQLKERISLQEQAIAAHETENKRPARSLQLQKLVEEKFADITGLVTQGQQASNSLIEQTKQKIEYGERHILDAVNKGLTNNVKQLEAFVNLTQYLNDGSMPLNFHGWPISPDIALFLIQKIEYNQYDLIIEFGSGTSTALFTKVIAKQHEKGQMLNSKLVTFEHNKKYYELTKQNLMAQGLTEYVDLVYAPLKEYEYDKEAFLYYQCEETLNKLNKLHAGHISILVLVDGPPGATGPLARFPALPHLLSAFSHQTMHLVLDDYHRGEEKQVADKWEELLTSRSIHFETESVSSEKGLYFCSIN